MITLDQFRSVLPARELTALAIEHQVDARNQIRLPGEAVLVCLLHGMLHHEEITQRLLEENYHQITGQHADHSSFGKRLTKIKPAYFEAVFDKLYERLAPKATRGETRALRVRFVDATIVTLSAKLLDFGLKAGTRSREKSRRAVKSVVELSEEGWPNLLHLCKQRSESSDSVALGKTMVEHSRPGDLWVFDKGCASRDRFLDIHNQRAYWLTPQGDQHIRVDRVVWEALPESLPSLAPTDGKPAFALVRVEQGVFENSRKTQKWEAMPLVRVQGLRYDQRAKAWKPLVLMTNLPLSEDGLLAGPFTFLELAELYRRRWEIETFFKFIKQHLGYSHLTSRNENGIQVMLYVAMIAALLLIWYKGQTGIDRGWRSVKSWFAHDVREWTEQALMQAVWRARLDHRCRT